MIIVGIEGKELQTYEKQYLQNLNCAGVILFSRNYENREQLQVLCSDIRTIRKELLICVDHEGGRVQRFRNQFTSLPAMGSLGKLFKIRPLLARELTRAAGIVLAYELRAVDIDFSFTPVLDLQDEKSTVIGNRAFSNNPAEVAELASILRQGMRLVGMAAVGKHFPGHGRVIGDSHHLLPTDDRPPEEREADLYPFYHQIKDGIEAIMPAHIVLPQEDKLPAGFSSHFIKKLRALGFKGAIISDDLDMNGALVAGSAPERVQAALNAGADVALMCNNFAGIKEALAAKYDHQHFNLSQGRLNALRGRCFYNETRRKVGSTLEIQLSRAGQQLNTYLAARDLLEKHAADLVA